MTDINITEEKVHKVISKLKNRKATGPDGLKGELYKSMANSKTCLEALTKCYQVELNKIEKPTKWKTSKTKLLKKKKKPTVRDLRPLALTDMSYKIFMSIIKEEIEQHLKNIKEDNEVQAGFKKGGRIEDNLLTLRYCVKDAYKNRRQLIVTAIDFRKAYDSVKREELIKAMLDFKINEKVIDVVSEIYTDDRVELTKGTGIRKEITATSGIRQGCTLSTTLFKLITYKIIQSMDRKIRGYSTDRITLRTLFYADDGLLFSTTFKGAKNDIEVMEKECGKYGLEINREKSNIMIFNSKEKPDKIGDIQVVKKIKYLGVEVTDEKDLFKLHRKEKLEKIEVLTNMTHGIIKKSCNRLIIGKAYLKSVVIPNILYGSAIIDWNRGEEHRLQVKQNEICRKMVNAPKYCAIPALRGEIGLSNMRTRLIQSRLQYVNQIKNNNNGLLKNVLEGLEEVDNDWKNRLKEYCEVAEIDSIENTTKK